MTEKEEALFVKQIVERINEYTEHDEDMFKEILPLYRKSFEQFADEYWQAVFDRNIEKVNFLRHKIRTNASMLGLYALLDLLDQHKRTMEGKKWKESELMAREISSQALVVASMLYKMEEKI